MSDQAPPPEPVQPPDTAPDQRPTQRRPPGQSWSSIIDEQIRAAQRAGKFDQLSVAGKPQDLTENPYAGDRRLEFHILQSHAMVPRELSLGSEVDAELAQAEESLAELRHRRDFLARRHFVTARDRRAYNVLLTKTAARYEAILQAARSKILSLNIIAPPTLHRPPLDVAARMAAFRQEFQPLAE